MSLFALWRDDMARGAPERLHEQLVREAHIVPERITALAIPTSRGAWQLAAFSCATRFYSASAQLWSAPGQGACVIHGVVWRMEGARARLLDAAAIAALLDRPGAALPADVGGEYAIARLFGDGALVAFADAASVHHLFHRPDRPHMIASRAGFLAALADDRTPEPESALWLAAIGYRVGQAGGWRGVRQVPQGCKWIAGGGFQTLPRPDRFAGPRGFGEGGEQLLEQGIAEAVAAIGVAAGDGPVELPVTGGKDSRAVLALCLAGGLRDRLSLVTRGRPDHPDVAVAERLAGAIGVPHRREPPRVGDGSADIDVEAFVERLAVHAYQTDGAMGGWDLLIGEAIGRATALTGHMGEVLKASVKRPSSGEADALAMIRAMGPFDPLGLLRPEPVAAMIEDIRRQADDALGEGAEAGDLPDLFYYRNRVPNWLGGIRGVRSHEAQPIMPLGAPALQALAFRLTPAERAAELVHFRIVRDCAPELLAAPFAHQRWSSALPGAPDVAPLLAPAGAPLFGNWQWSLNHRPAIRAWLVEFVRSSDIPLWQAIDRARLLEMLRERRFDYLDGIALLGLIVGAFHQAGLTIPRKIGASSGEPARGARAAHPFFSGEEARLPPIALAGYVDAVEGAARRDGTVLAITGEGRVTIAGWAWSPAWPGAAPTIEARADGRIVGRAYPEANRPDVAAAGIGDGRHGFTLTLAAADLAGARTLTIGHADAALARFAIAPAA